MRPKHTWLTLAVLVLFSAGTPSAQTAGTAAPPDFGTLLTPGMTVWITDSSGQKQRARIVDVSKDAVTTSADGPLGA